MTVSTQKVRSWAQTQVYTENGLFSQPAGDFSWAVHGDSILLRASEVSGDFPAFGGGFIRTEVMQWASAPILLQPGVRAVGRTGSELG